MYIFEPSSILFKLVVCSAIIPPWKFKEIFKCPKLNQDLSFCLFVCFVDATKNHSVNETWGCSADAGTI